MIVKTTAVEAKIYRKSATVTRTGSVNLNSGRNTIYIAGMTKTANQDTFTVKMSEKIRTVNVQIVNIDSLPDEPLESEKIAGEISKLNYQVELCNTITELRKTNANFTYRSNISIEEQEAYLEGLSDKLVSLNQKAQDLSKQKEKLAEELNKASFEEEKPLIMLEVECDEAGEYPLILTYQELSCNWYPKYEVRFEDEKSPLEVCMKACISQTSGENWQKIQAILYTGNPTVSQEVPVLKSTYLSLIDDSLEKARGNAMMAESAMMVAGTASAMAAASPMNAFMGMSMMNQMMTQQAQVQEEETMTAFVLPDTKDILTNTDGNIATLQKFNVDASYEILCIPSVTDKSFMTAVIKSEDWPFASAEASVYLKGTLIGKVYVDPDSDSETFTLSLGQDERLNVIREELPAKQQNVLLKNQKKKTPEYKIKITNKSSAALENVIIKDTIPVSSDKAISVELKEVSGAAVDEEKGILKWNLNIDSQSTVSLNVSYDITWPKDKRYRESRH